MPLIQTVLNSEEVASLLVLSNDEANLNEVLVNVAKTVAVRRN